MPAVETADPLYRVIVDYGNGGCVLRGRRFVTLASAHAALIAALRGDTDERVCAVEVQRGVRVEFACADAYTVEPGVRGGWGYVSWETVERLTPWTLEALRPPPVTRIAAHEAARSGRRAALAGVTATALTIAAIFGLQALGSAGGSAVAGMQRTGPMKALPLSRAAVERAPAPAPTARHSLEQTLRTALSSRAGNAPLRP